MPLPLRSPVRVHPFTGLVVDVDTWATAHDYHRHHQELHLLTMHGSGIAYGLDVLPTDPPSETIVIEPGVAIDQMGNIIVVPDRQHLALGTRAGTTFISLDFVESIPSSGGDQKDTRARVLEDFRLRILTGQPETPALELGRIRHSGSSAAVVNAANPWAPAPDQIDGRYRLRLPVRAPRDMTISVVLHRPENLSPSHMLGLQFFARELENDGVRPRLITASDSAVPPADLLYVSGSAEAALPQDLINRLSERVANGAWLFADPCGTGTDMVQSLVGAVKTTAECAAETEQLILGARNVFGTAPAGAYLTREILWGDKAVVSPRDYGCAWSGRRGDQIFQRDLIRSALEFGVNVAYGAMHDVVAR